LDGGYDALNRLRISALNAISDQAAKANRSTKANKIGLRMRVHELEADNQRLREDLLRLTRALGRSLVQGRHYAERSDKPAVLALCAREQRELRSELSLMSTEFESNVVSIRRD
jgi:hypothetical protein